MTFILANLAKKLREEEVIISKADKGNTLVLLDRSKYNQKTVQCLHSIGVTVDPEFDFDGYVQKVLLTVNKCEYILDKEPLKEAVLVSNPRIPCLYGLPKIHQTPSPTRPI